ncbi:MAG: response regulator [Lachnospiraceae bacterium]|nr:response regulator [Lachnospiraceae bacterium]
MQTLLIVEDEKLIRQGIRVMVQRSGVPVENIIECGNGLMALEVLKSQKVDVMFTDIRMPKMDGIELVKAMQELPHQPLTVAISGYDDFSYAVGMMRGGVREYLLKPVDRESLKSILEKLEQEVEAAREEEQRKSLSDRERLRRIMESEEMSDSERQAIGERLEGQLFPSYVVCCFGSLSEPAAGKKGVFLMLEGLSAGSICIVESSSSPFLLKNELGDACVGVSREHSGASELRQAYLEAAQARKRAFCRCEHICRFSEMGVSHETTHLRRMAVECPSDVSDAKNALRCGTADIKASNEAEPTTEEIRKLVQTLGTDRYEDCRYQASLFLQKVKRGVYIPAQMERYLNALLEQIPASYAAIFKEPQGAEVAGESLRGQSAQNQSPQVQSGSGALADLQKRLTDMYSYRSLDEYTEALSRWLELVHEKTDNRSDEFRNRQKLEKAIRYIRENYSSDLNMAVVSNHVSMNYSLFSQEFKQYTGENFVSFLRNIRMEEAKRLLAQTQLRVVEISQKVGYENEKHFMKTFKSVYGISPSEFRKNVEYTV